MTFDNRLIPKENYIDNTKIQVTFDGSCLKQELTLSKDINW